MVLNTTGLRFKLIRPCPRRREANMLPRTFMARAIRKLLRGDVSKTRLLTMLLPLSFVASFGTLIVAAYLFPSHYDWQRRVISDLTSPRANPDFYWLPTLGIAVSALLSLPFAGFMERGLHGIAPRLARTIGVAFALGFVLLMLACVAVPSHKPSMLFLRRLHETSARGFAVAAGVGMLSCCWCAMKDRLNARGGQKSLRPALAYLWLSLTLVPIGCLAIAGILVFGHNLHQEWADTVREWFRHTPMWRLAFWEWFGIVAFFAFMMVSALLLPERTRTDS